MNQRDIEKMIAAWKRASDDLQIKIQAPFILKTADSSEFKFHLLIEKFGSKLGTLILSANDMTEFDTPEKYGYYCSALNPDNYSEYEREHFIETLNDWGYFGEQSEKPSWCIEKRFEKVILGDPPLIHDLVSFNYNMEKLEFTLTICKSEESGNIGPTKIFKFKNVQEFQPEKSDAASLEQLLRPIIGIDNHLEQDGREKVVINCDDIEFVFKTDSEPQRIQ